MGEERMTSLHFFETCSQVRSAVSLASKADRTVVSTSGDSPSMLAPSSLILKSGIVLRFPFREFADICYELGKFLERMRSWFLRGGKFDFNNTGDRVSGAIIRSPHMRPIQVTLNFFYTLYHFVG